MTTERSFISVKNCIGFWVIRFWPCSLSFNYFVPLCELQVTDGYANWVLFCWDLIGFLSPLQKKIVSLLTYKSYYLVAQIVDPYTISDSFSFLHYLADVSNFSSSLLFWHHREQKPDCMDSYGDPTLPCCWPFRQDLRKHCELKPKDMISTLEDWPFVGWIHAGTSCCLGVQSGKPHRALLLEGRISALMLCCCHLEIFDKFEQKDLHFHFALGNANYVAGSDCEFYSGICGTSFLWWITILLCQESESKCLLNKAWSYFLIINVLNLQCKPYVYWHCYDVKNVRWMWLWPNKHCEGSQPKGTHPTHSL